MNQRLSKAVNDLVSEPCSVDLFVVAIFGIIELYIEQYRLYIHIVSSYTLNSLVFNARYNSTQKGIVAIKKYFMDATRPVCSLWALF